MKINIHVLSNSHDMPGCLQQMHREGHHWACRRDIHLGAWRFSTPFTLWCTNYNCLTLTASFQPLHSNCFIPTTSFQLLHSNHFIPTASFQLPCSNCLAPTALLQLPHASGRSRYMPWASGGSLPRQGDSYISCANWLQVWQLIPLKGHHRTLPSFLLLYFCIFIWCKNT